MKYKTLKFEDGVLKLIDQRILPLEKQYYEASNYKEVCQAIQKMVVRGAPAIGATGAFGYYLAVKDNFKNETRNYSSKMDQRFTLFPVHQHGKRGVKPDVFYIGFLFHDLLPL